MSSTPTRLVVMDEAALQITEQSEYYEQKESLSLALRWESAVEAAIGSLRTFPERGAPVLDAEGLPRNLRRLNIGGFPNHLLLYQFEARTSVVWIVCVLHGARDFDLFLQMHAREWL